MSVAKARGELRIGIIGAGGRGGLATLAHKPAERSRITAICDIRDEVFEHYSKNYGTGLFATRDYRKLLARPDVDVVFVCSPDYLHEEQAVAALKAGKTVYLEKPMAITIKGCDRILKVAMETGSRLYLGHNMRHMDVFLKMKERIEAGDIGEVKTAWCRHFVSYGGDAYFKDWHAVKNLQTGLLLQKGTHDIDMLHWLCNGYSRRVSGMGKLMVFDKVKKRHPRNVPGVARFELSNWPPLEQKDLHPDLDVEDVSMMMMELDNGVLASYEQCQFTPDAWRNYTVIGTKGRIENINDGGDCIVRVWNRRSDCYKEHGDVEHHLHPVSGGHGGGDPAIVREFLRFARGELFKTNTSPVAARYSVAAGYQATMSLRQGGVPKDVPPLAHRIEQYFNRLRKSG